MSETHGMLIRKHPQAVVLGCALAGVVFLTWLGFHLQLGIATAGFLYLVPVVLVALYGGFWAATATSVLAVGCLDYFFVPPVLTWQVNSPSDWVALGTFEFTALVVSRLSHIANKKRAEADAERRDSERLYEASRRVLLFDRTRHPGSMLTSLLVELFELDAAVLFDAEPAEIYFSGNNSPEQEERARKVYYADSDQFDPTTSSSFSVLRLEGRAIGGLALKGGRISPLRARALGSLCAIALERSRSTQRECRAEAARQSEQLRAAVLDALAHDFKTPVATIWAASSGLLAVGGLSEMQSELLTLVDQQARKLNDLATRLLGTARLDGLKFEPQCESLRLSDIAEEVLEAVEPASARSRFRCFRPANEPPAWVDRKLAAAAIGQLADNAIKYSIPDSFVDVSFLGNGAELITSVSNKGPAIKPAERARIFERFYRTDTGEDTPSGTGLGLSIVKKIVEAHGGRVWVESGPHLGTTFFMAFPLAASHGRSVAAVPSGNEENAWQGKS